MVKIAIEGFVFPMFMANIPFSVGFIRAQGGFVLFKSTMEDIQVLIHFYFIGNYGSYQLQTISYMTRDVGFINNQVAIR